MSRAAVRVIVPCFNEEKRFPTESFLSFIKREEDYDFLFVDDGSSDGTAVLLEKVCALMPDRLHVLKSQPNQGKAAAVRLGFLHALESQTPRFLAYWDADLATPLETLPEFFRVFRERPEVEIVLGSRVKLLGWDIQRQILRHYLGRVFATCASHVLRLPVYDTQCGAKMFRVNAVLHEIWREPFLSRWIFDVELLARYLSARQDNPFDSERRIYESPLKTWRDVKGSKVKPADFFKAFAELFRIQMRYGRIISSSCAKVGS
ncbi:MAG: glycosyltransferase [Candidatus Omnitrophica bacterium]|nr:glycosyltransferase [Candidatus Omnitrophota bacterium]